MLYRAVFQMVFFVDQSKKRNFNMSPMPVGQVVKGVYMHPVFYRDAAAALELVGCCLSPRGIRPV